MGRSSVTYVLVVSRVAGRQAGVGRAGGWRFTPVGEKIERGRNPHPWALASEDLAISAISAISGLACVS